MAKLIIALQSKRIEDFEKGLEQIIKMIKRGITSGYGWKIIEEEMMVT